ncbi:MAG: hypothetical protein HeimC3_33860, partial [Candidatus Heimdallarchaeota archaeon LC_3]
MARNRINDLKVAQDLLKKLDFLGSAKLVSKMIEEVEKRRPIDWQLVVETFELLENECSNRDDFFKTTFVILEKTILETVKNSQTELKKHALDSRPLEHFLSNLDSSLGVIYEKIQLTLDDKVNSVLLTMFGIIVRWQVIEDIVIDFVGHYCRGLNDESKSGIIETLLSINFSMNSDILRSDT